MSEEPWEDGDAAILLPSSLIVSEKWELSFLPSPLLILLLLLTATPLKTDCSSAWMSSAGLARKIATSPDRMMKNLSAVAAYSMTICPY